MDVDNMPVGLDFREHLQQILDQCDILIAVIGPKWLALDTGGKPRIQDETDWVRLEIATALSKNIPIIPLLIDDAQCPSPPIYRLNCETLLFDRLRS